MLSYYWANAARELDLNTRSWNLGVASPAQIASAIASHPNSELRKHWQQITMELAKVNPSLLRRIADQILNDQGDASEGNLLVDQILHMFTN